MVILEHLAHVPRTLGTRPGVTTSQTLRDRYPVPVVTISTGPALPMSRWDDVKKRCEYESMACTTTTPSSETGPPMSSNTIPPVNLPGTTGSRVSDSRDMPEGDYPSCKTEEGYVTCKDFLLCEKVCPASAVWDDVKKRCVSISTECVSDCSHIHYGRHWSCKFCDGYVTCTNGFLCEHLCNDDLVWDDVKTHCEKETTTCRVSSTNTYPPTDCQGELKSLEDLWAPCILCRRCIS